jgi:hypothetical protein
MTFSGKTWRENIRGKRKGIMWMEIVRFRPWANMIIRTGVVLLYDKKERMFYAGIYP